MSEKQIPQGLSFENIQGEIRRLKLLVNCHCENKFTRSELKRHIKALEILNDKR